MKVLEPPNRFFPNRAFSVEDTNRDLSHAANMIRNDQDARFVYSNIRIPIAIVSNRQEVNTDIPGTLGLPTPHVLYKRNHEAIRTFSFIPPFEMKIVKTELLVMAGSNAVGEINENDPMVATVEWISEQGGEGFPPSPQSVLPEGMKEAGDPDIVKIHPQLSVSMSEDDNIFSVVDNGEYRLEEGKCYRVRMSDPDIPTLSAEPGFSYNDTRFWRYKLGYIDLTLKYDKWIFQDPDRPDVNLFNAGDPINMASLNDELASLGNSRAETTTKVKYPKPELYWFGLGQMNNYWARPVNGNGLAPFSSQQANAPSVMEDQTVQSSFSDFDAKWRGTGLTNTWYTYKSGNFHRQGVWRSPMAPSKDADASHPGFEFGKQVVGYSVGMVHCPSNEFSAVNPLRNATRSHGYEFWGTLGHSLSFDNDDTLSASDNYETPRGATSDFPKIKDPSSTPLTYPNSIGGVSFGSTAAWNDTVLGSTAIPNTQLNVDPHAGVATGFPGDYLAEIHGIGQWGKDPDAQTETTDINTSTIDQNFKESPSTIRPPSGSDTLDELFLLFQSLQTGMTVGSDEDLRNFQKFYILLWVI